MDLGRQRTYTGIRTLPIEVREAIFHFKQQSSSWLLRVSCHGHRGSWAENGRKKDRIKDRVLMVIYLLLYDDGNSLQNVTK